MKNSIDVRVEFSFKGEDYDLTSRIDLDNYNAALSPYQILARQHDIDTISYLFEVMQEADLEFSNAQGAAADWLHEGYLNQSEFSARWQDHKISLRVAPIAKRELGIEHLAQHPALKNALVQAYKLGQGL